MRAVRDDRVATSSVRDPAVRTHFAMVAVVLSSTACGSTTTPSAHTTTTPRTEDTATPIPSRTTDTSAEPPSPSAAPQSSAPTPGASPANAGDESVASSGGSVEANRTPVQVDTRQLDACPSTTLGPSPLVRVGCAAFTVQQLGLDLMLPAQHPPHVDVRSAAEFRRAFGCDAPADFDWSRNQVVAVTWIFPSSMPPRVVGSSGNVVRVENERVCQGTRTISLRQVIPIAVPVHAHRVELQFCNPPQPPCGPVP